MEDILSSGLGWATGNIKTMIVDSITNMIRGLLDILFTLIIYTVALGLIGYLFYMTLMKITYADYYCGVVPLLAFDRIPEEVEGKWHVVTTTVVTQNYILWRRINVITLVYQLANISRTVPIYTPDSKNVWIKTAHALELAKDMQVHQSSGNVHTFTTIPIEIEDNRVRWANDAEFDLRALAGQVTDVQLCCLVPHTPYREANHPINMVARRDPAGIRF